MLEHGLPDGSLSGRAVTVSASFDTGELAARLHSPVVFDRRGNVIFLDDFRNGFTCWSSAFTGAGGSVYATSYPTMRGGLAVNLIPGQAPGNLGQIQRMLPYPVKSKIGVEVSFVAPADMRSFQIWADFDDGSDLMRSELSYHHGAGTLNIETADGVYQEVADIGAVLEGYTNFNIVKMVVDLTTMKYHRLIFNETQYDISAYSLWKKVTSGYKYMPFSIGCYNDKVGIIEVIIDDVIVTQNED